MQSTSDNQHSSADLRQREHDVNCKLVEMAFSHGIYAAVFSLINAVIVFTLFCDNASSATLWGWFIAMVLVILMRVGFRIAFYRRDPDSSPLYWATLFTLGTGITGLLWGLTIPLFAPGMHITYQAFLLLMVGGMVAAASVFQASIYNSYLAFSLPALMPLITFLAQSGLPIRFAATGLAMLFTILMLIVAKRMNTSITTAVRLEFNNLALLRDLERSEERFRTLTENSASAYFILQDNQFTYLNPMGQRMTGYSLEDLRKMKFPDLVHPEHREMVLQRAAARLSLDTDDEQPKRYEFKLIHKDGHTIWLDYTAGVLELSGRKAIMGTAFDITDKKLAEDRIADSEKRFRMLFNMANDPMFLMELGDGLEMGRFKDVNHAACDVLGYTREELLDFRPKDIDAEDNPNLFRAILAKLSMDGKIVYETELRKKDGTSLPVEVSSHMSEFEGKTIVHSTCRDISMRKQLMEKLTELANTDPLTGSLNRRSFWNRGASEVDRANRYGRPMVMLMIDIDHFKVINDTHGHSMGDMVLRSLVTRCHAELRATDIFGRVGGEEFAALLVETDEAEGLAVAERIRLSLQNMTATYGPKKVTCTVSIGLALARKEEKNLDELVNRADRALYHAKETGRNRVVCYTDMP